MAKSNPTASLLKVFSVSPARARSASTGVVLRKRENKALRARFPPMGHP